MLFEQLTYNNKLQCNFMLACFVCDGIDYSSHHEISIQFNSAIPHGDGTLDIQIYTYR